MDIRCGPLLNTIVVKVLSTLANPRRAVARCASAYRGGSATGDDPAAWSTASLSDWPTAAAGTLWEAARHGGDGARWDRSTQVNMHGELETVVVCFGRDANGELGGSAPASSADSRPGSTTVAGSSSDGRPVNLHFVELPSPIQRVSCGLYHSCALASSGELYIWGAGSGGQLGRAKDQASTFGAVTNALVGAPERVMMGEGAVAVAAGRNHSLAIGASGRAFSWGRAASGQLGHGVSTAAGGTRRINDADLSEPKQLQAVGGASELPRFASVSAGEHFSAALAHSGQVYTWGSEANGRLGRSSAGQAEPRPLPRSVFGGELVTVVALGWRHALARTQSGQVYSWGSGACGELGRGSRKDASAPALIETLGREKVEKISAGRAHSLASTADGFVFAWGDNSSGQLGTGTSDGGPPISPGCVATAAAAAAAPGGAGGGGGGGSGGAADDAVGRQCELRPQAIRSLLDHGPFVALAAGGSHSAFVSASGRAFT